MVLPATSLTHIPECKPGARFTNHSIQPILSVLRHHRMRFVKLVPEIQLLIIPGSTTQIPDPPTCNMELGHSVNQGPILQIICGAASTQLPWQPILSVFCHHRMLFVKLIPGIQLLIILDSLTHLPLHL